MRGVSPALMAERLSDAVLVEDVQRFRGMHPEGAEIMLRTDGKVVRCEVVAGYRHCCALRDMETGRVFEMQWKEIFMRAGKYGREG